MNAATPVLRQDFTYTREVADALAGDQPVVALESTIISHGMPYPRNVEMAVEVEQLVREGGAVPATLAVLDGRPHIGLDPDQLDVLARGDDVRKVSVRDLPYVMARGLHGATTVAATMRLASLAGIRTFVTGGLGGVHRGAATSFDVSADLIELGRTSVAVISAGVKSILDIALTLEYLETQSVPVLVNGSDDFPAFFSRSSGLPAPLRVDGAEDIARVMEAQWRTGLAGGLAIANPVPQQDEIAMSDMQGVIDQALEDMAAAGVRGSAATPFLLARIVELTDGASLNTNIALVRHNARLGAAVASAYRDLASM